MSVPLDRLYHYLDDCVNHDLIIYRWMPHGSRKLEDFNPLKNYTNDQWIQWPIVICHDQEPLNYDFYTQEQIKHSIKLLWEKNSIQVVESLLNYATKQHLRGIAACINHYDLTILVHSERRSQEVERFVKHNFLPVYYWSHGLIARDWFRYAEHDPNLTFDFDLVQKDFLVYNRAWSGTREYRLMFAQQVIHNNLVTDCKMSFNPVDDSTHYTDHQFVNKKFVVQNHNMEKHFPPNTHPASASADYCGNDYVVSGIEVVLETLFDDSRLHLTEKTLRPVACGKPFILASTAGSLQYLRDYGFKTFDGLIDESYDLISDSHQRLQAIVQEMKRISALDVDAKQRLYTKLHQVADRNKQWFFNGFSDYVIGEYQTNITQSLSIIKQHCTKKHHTHMFNLLEQN